MSAAPARNVILVVFDSLRRDALGCYGGSPPWGSIHTPNLNAFAEESVMFTRAFPESLPTLCARRAIYTGQRTYPFHNGDFRYMKGDWCVGYFPGWGPIPEQQHTLSEIFSEQKFRTGLVSDLYHQFKPGKNFWRGFDQWTFIRGQETDHSRSGRVPTKEEIERWIPPEFSEVHDRVMKAANKDSFWFDSKALLNMRDRVREELWFNAQVMQEAGRWVEQNQDAERMFLTVECFDPHEPWFVPEHYRKRYDAHEGREQVISPYAEIPDISEDLLRRTRANYSGLVEMCDRWFGHLMESLRVNGMLEDSIVIVTSDHGHSLWDRRGFIGKRPYPSDPETYDVPLMIRHPGKLGAGTKCDAFVQAHDIAATVLEATGVTSPEPIDGKSFYKTAFAGGAPIRDHVTVGWGVGMTVIDDNWWFNAKIDGTGAFLYPAHRPQGEETSMAAEHPEIVEAMFRIGKEDAGGSFPQYLLDRAATVADAGGSVPFATRD
ncbi:sulfatase [Lacisediminimonas profundi]|uniref:sulfatase n=1 Tax=Lacisediminimonas profundi TaxID=2603856 RepID=UPI00124B2363|nr:sulfatase [Lacisediminimonas profundi]